MYLKVVFGEALLKAAKAFSYFFYRGPIKKSLKSRSLYNRVKKWFFTADFCSTIINAFWKSEAKHQAI